MHFEKVDSEFIKQFWQMINEANEIVLTTHISPDDDAIGSLLSINEAVRTKYPEKKVRMIITGDYFNTYESFPDYINIEFVKDLADEDAKANLLIVLDGSQYSRFSNKPIDLKVKYENTICIDHHSSPPDEWTLSLIDTKSPATAEIVYRLFFENDNLNKKTAEYLFLGISGDTGGFNYIRPDQSNVLSVAKKLLEVGNIEIQEFYSRYRKIKEKVFKALIELMKNTSLDEVEGYPKFNYSYLSREYCQQNNLNQAEISEASHIYMDRYVRHLENRSWGFAVTPKPDEVGFSLRSLPKSVSCRDICERFHGGGGHDRAAGTSIKGGNLEVLDCINEFLAWMEVNKPVIV